MKRFEEFLGVDAPATVYINGACSVCDEEVKGGPVTEGFLVMTCTLGHETKIKWDFDV